MSYTFNNIADRWYFILMYMCDILLGVEIVCAHIHIHILIHMLI